eukprot:scaffold6865_cov417-Prasinococcus_capsulatus_cf.AAC.3
MADKALHVPTTMPPNGRMGALPLEKAARLVQLRHGPCRSPRPRRVTAGKQVTSSRPSLSELQGRLDGRCNCVAGKVLNALPGFLTTFCVPNDIRSAQDLH